MNKRFKLRINAFLNKSISLQLSFFKPTPERYKILLEAKAFPSDHVRMLQIIFLLEGIMLSEVSQSEKDKHYMFSFFGEYK